MKDITGVKFGRLLAVKPVDKDIKTNKSNEKYWLCECDCGRTTIVSGRALRNSSIKSCGCLNIERSKQSNTTHNKSNTRLYRIYYSLKRRCYKATSKDYNNYGERGITIYDKWLGKKGFINFYNWSIENGYSDELTIDRIDVNGNYEPNNCRWVTPMINSNNKRNNVYILFNGERKTIAEWARVYGMNYSTLRRRISKYKWSIDKALLTPVRHKK